MNPIRSLVESLADHIHAPGDREAAAWGLTVERLPWGKRRIYDPRIAIRARLRSTGAVNGPLDRLAA